MEHRLHSDVQMRCRTFIYSSVVYPQSLTVRLCKKEAVVPAKFASRAFCKDGKFSQTSAPRTL